MVENLLTANERLRLTARGIVLSLLFLAALTAALHQVGQREQLQWETPQLDVRLGAAHYRVPPQQLVWLQEFSALYFAGREAEARALLQQESSLHLAQVFDSAAARLPEFADWYYSLPGEYSRLSMKVLAGLNLTERDYIAERAAAILFPEGRWELDMQQVQQQLSNRMAANQQQVRAAWLSELSSRLSRYQVPAPLPETGAQAQQVLVLDEFLGAELIRQQQQALDLRTSLSTVAAMGAAGRTLWQAASARGAAAAGKAAVARGAGRGAARAGSAALSGGVLCAPAGPAALGCAAVAGTAAWIASDWLLLRLDAALNREELIASMDSGLDELEQLTHQEVVSAYDGLISAWYDSIATEIQTDFIPMQTLGNQ